MVKKTLIKAIIFDFYDTLAKVSRETDPYKKLFNRLFPPLISYSEYRSIVLTNHFDFLSDIVEELGFTTIDVKDLQSELNEELSSVHIFEDVAETLDYLSRKFELYLLSNLATPYKVPYFKLGLNNWIHTAFFSCDMGFMKPDEKAYKHILESIFIKPEEVLMVGDNYQTDVLGPKQCGMDSVWLRRNEPKGEGHIQSLNELMDYLSL